MKVKIDDKKEHFHSQPASVPVVAAAGGLLVLAADLLLSLVDRPSDSSLSLLFSLKALLPWRLLLRFDREIC